MEDKIYYRIIKKIFDKSKNETTLAHIMLEDMLDKLNINYDSIEISENGKPYFKNNNVFFNYSHSKNYILLAISFSELGVDIEENRIISDRISQKYLNNIDNENRLKYWVIKESYVKLLDKPNLLYEDIDIKNIKFKKYVIEKNKYIFSIMYKGKKKELIEI